MTRIPKQQAKRPSSKKRGNIPPILKKNLSQLKNQYTGLYQQSKIVSQNIKTKTKINLGVMGVRPVKNKSRQANAKSVNTMVNSTQKTNEYQDINSYRQELLHLNKNIN